MLTEQERDRVCVVLVRARNPSNIGAAARAMHDFGFSRLRVVNEFAAPFEGARSAIDASEVLARAVRCASVAEAVADCTLVAGTTAVGERNLQHKLLELAEAAPLICAELRREPAQRDQAAMDEAGPAGGGNAPQVALLFGSEKTGLSNEELSHCNWLLTIPMQQHDGLRHASMNLGQAVAVCLYELARKPAESAQPAADGETAGNGTRIQSPAPADAATLERLTALLTEVLEKTGYPRRHPGQSDPATVRRLLLRMGVDEENAVVWQGILRQVLWKLGARPE